MRKEKERKQKHHKIWRCIGKAIPQSKELQRTIKAPTNIEYLSPAKHKEKHTQTTVIFEFLQAEFKDKKIKESVIYLDDMLEHAQEKTIYQKQQP